MMFELRQWCCVLVGLCLGMGALAVEPEVLLKSAAAQVTEQDVLVEIQRIPADTRKSVMSRPSNVAQTAQTLMVRRLLAQEAESNGLAEKPEIVAALRIARERVLSDAHLLQMDEANRPTAVALDEYARTKYQAESQRFETPEQTRARHILVRGETLESQTKAEKLLLDLKAGANFEELAKEVSDDPGSAAKGGDLGFFSVGRMVPQFDAAVKELTQPGELSALVKTQFGWHIIQLVERRAAGKRSYEEVRDDLHREALVRILGEKRADKSRSLLEKAKFNEKAVEAFAASQR